MHRIFFLLTLLIALSTTATFAQEICNNGIDDDKDGFIDCFDGECAKNSACTGGYLGNDLNCEVKPSAFPKFTLDMESASPNGTTTNLGRIVIGDIDRDGLPEMITTNKVPQKIFILNGENTGGVNTIQKQLKVNYQPMWEDILIGNLDNDNCAEIFVLGNDYSVHAYDCQLNQIWSTKLPGDPGTMGLADFNGDGKVELYARNAIYNAHTGAVIVAPTASWANINGGPVAVDLLSDATKSAHTAADVIKDDNLELVCGGVIYSVNIAGGTINAEKTIPNYYKRQPSDATSIADYNLDGSLDVIAVGSRVNSTNEKIATTTIFYWDVKNNVVKTYEDFIPGKITISSCNTSTSDYYVTGWHSGAGRVNIADLDGDGKLNASYVSGKYLYALKDDFTLLWRIVVNEETSGNTGCTLFDFNGDGQSEVVYRDEKFVYIINGKDGSFNADATKPCISRTNREYPIVADVDGDGTTELCVTCASNNAQTQAEFCDLNNAQNSQVRVFRSGSEPWVPARRIWNQHGYFNVNVNDDLTIPRVQQKHHLAFSSDVCTIGPNRPLNSFLNQSPFLNSQGCPKYASPDIAYVDNSLTTETPTCPDGDFNVSFQITNKGDLSMNGDIPITFYSGNPTTASATKLNTITITLSNFKVGAIQSLTNVTVKGPGSAFTLYVVLNDDGTTNLPLKLPNTQTLECNYVNNLISIQIKPKPVDLTAIKVQDNYKCSTGSAGDNGAVKAFVLKGTVENTTDYNFYWSAGTVAKPIANVDFKGAIWTGRPAGTYTVYAVHKTAGCASDTAQITIVEANRVINTGIKLVHAFDHCTPANGALRAIVNDPDGDGIGEDPSHFTYAWYAGNDIFTSPLLGINDTLSALGPLAFTVLVTDKLSGCQTIESFTVPDLTVIPDVSTTSAEATCTDPTSGKVTADVGGVTAGYTFKWYNGASVKATADFTGPVYSSRTQGNYTVVAISNVSGCISAPKTVAVGKSPTPVVTTTLISDQTSCDALQPTGSASANVGGTTTGYTFEWFKGQNTLGANSVATTSTATALTNSIYTVKATNATTGCIGTAEVTVKFAVVTPTLSLAAKVDPNNCSNPNGSITINVSPDSPSDYSFSWYIGEDVKATTDFTDTDQTLSGLSPGQYTVKAVNNTRHCNAQPLTVRIIDAAPVINFNQTALIRPNTCSDNTGLITVEVSAPGNTLGFDLEWRKGQEPYVNPAITTVSQIGNITTVSQLTAGLYSLIAINKDNGCSSTKTFDLPFDNAQVVTSVSKTDIHTCVPGTDGSLTINLTKTPGFQESDYAMFVYNGKNDLGSAGSAAFTVNGVNGILDYIISSSLAPGFYTVVAVTTNPSRSTFNCRSVPITIELMKDTERPVFVADAPVNNMSCGGVPGSGELTVVLTIPTTNPADYTFDWHEGVDASAPLLGTSTSGNKAGVNGEKAQNLVAGQYTVVVTKNGGINGGCTRTATYEIFEDLPLISLSSANLNTINIERCDMISNGSVTVTAVQENGAPASPSNYNFEWYNDSPGGPQLIAGMTTNVLSNQPAGKYFVRTINKTSNCSAGDLIEVVIQDNTMNTVTVGLVSFVVPTSCLKPANVSGEFEVSSDGTSSSGYTYNWYAGQNTSAPALAAINVTGVDGEKAVNLVSGFYTIEVVNNMTQCKIIDTYELPVDKRPITLAISNEPMTVCFPSPKDGSVFATITSGNKNDYAYSWFVNTVKASADFTSDPNTPVSNLTPASYIVIAVDNLDASCTISDTTRVLDQRVSPVVLAIALSPLTICDPARPDGVASASVNGEYLNYNFDWFNIPAPSGTPFYTGPQASELAAGTYSVIGTSVLTGCSDTTQVVIEMNQAAIPVPHIEVLSLVTSCLDGNGQLTAAVGGNTSDYIFNWYNGSTIKPSADFTGEYYYDLSIGTYGVTATSRVTGCVSPIVTQDLGEEHLYPDFSWTTVAAVCMRDASEQSNGLAAIFVTDSVAIGSIEWHTDGGVVAGPILSGVNAGTYSVTVTSDLGCATTKDVEIKSEIHPYNGISRNKDNQNELFFINCIESFPSNTVKIFNRVGTLVYEAEGYDNAGTFFDGKSNKGISLMGNNLPAGTYFYIIDKHDGSKPLAGYLELLN